MEILENIIYPLVDEVNSNGSLPAGIALIKATDAPLFGPNAPMDSLGLVTFIVALEERLESNTGKTIRLVSEKAMSRKNSPFLTLGALATYIDELLIEA